MKDPVQHGGPSGTTSVWLVWTENGSYEDFSRDCCGVFASQEVAEEHAAQIRALDMPDECEVVEHDILLITPKRVPFIEWGAHILPDGKQDRDLGYERYKSETWSNQISVVSGKIERWSNNVPDLYVSVVGSDRGAVKAEYARLLKIARQQLDDVIR